MSSLHPLPQTVLAYVRRLKLLRAGDRVGVAVSGGADSVALQRLLFDVRGEIGIVLSVLHFNHQLRGSESDGDEQFVAELARTHGLEFHSDRGDAAAYAKQKHLTLEAAARALRYQFFLRMMTEHRLDRIATGHTLDDQAETVLMRLARGAGTRGLAGIYPRLRVEDGDRVAHGDLLEANLAHSKSPKKSIVRPLLHTRRSELEAYLAELRQEWREDSSNRDLRYARNRIRHGILPRLERNLNPGTRQSLADTAEIARAEEQYWSGEVSRLMPQLWNRESAALSIAGLKPLALALQRRIVRSAAESLGLRLSFRQGEEILEMASAETLTTKATPAKSLELAQDRRVIRDKSELRFEVPRPAELTGRDYSYRLPVPGHIEVPEAGAHFEAVLISATKARPGAGYNPEQLLDATQFGAELVVRNWRAGDRFWPAHTKSSKKVKQLLQGRNVAGRERKLWPVVTRGEAIIWMRDFPVPQQCMPRAGGNALLIRERPISETPYE